LSAQLAAFEMNQRDLRVLPVRTHPTCRHPACVSTDCRKPKLTRIPAHIQLRHHNHELYQMQHRCRADHTLASSTNNFDYRPLTFFSALHNISSSVFSDIIHSASSVHCFATQPTCMPASHYTTTDTLYQHFHLLSSDIGVLDRPKKTWVHRWRH